GVPRDLGGGSDEGRQSTRLALCWRTSSKEKLHAPNRFFASPPMGGLVQLGPRHLAAALALGAVLRSGAPRDGERGRGGGADHRGGGARAVDLPRLGGMDQRSARRLAGDLALDPQGRKCGRHLELSG